MAADTLVPRARLAELKALQDNAFSAATFQLSNDTVVVFNPLNAQGRQNSDIAHELAHVALNHNLRRTERVGAFSFFTCDTDQEDEANWLAGALLLPRSVIMGYLHGGFTPERIAEAQEVSIQMVRFRLQATGASLQFGREQRKRA